MVDVRCGGYRWCVTRDQWRSIAARHTRHTDDPRRCADCAGYWPCVFWLRAGRELLAARL